MPEDARVGGNIIYYNFTPFYTVPYMTKAIKYLLLELKTRDDLSSRLGIQLQQMISYFVAKVEKDNAKITS